MANLIKKVVVLAVLLVIVFTVYMIKNQNVREDVLIKLGLAASKDFKIPDDIKIGMEDITMETLESSGNIEEKEVTEEEVYSSPEVVVNEGGIGMGSVEAWEDEPISLEEVQNEIEQIALQVEIIKQQADILIAMKEIREEIKELASQAEEFNIECPECNILSSI